MNTCDLSLSLSSTEKSYTFPLSDIFPDFGMSHSLDNFPRRNFVGKPTFLLLALNLEIFFH